MENMTKTANPINCTVTEEDYANYLRNKKGYPNNSRIRPDDEDIFDALLSVDMEATQEGREIMEAIRNL